MVEVLYFECYQVCLKSWCTDSTVCSLYGFNPLPVRVQNSPTWCITPCIFGVIRRFSFIYELKNLPIFSRKLGHRIKWTNQEMEFRRRKELNNRCVIFNIIADNRRMNHVPKYFGIFFGSPCFEVIPK